MTWSRLACSTGRTSRFRFRHPLLQEAAYHEVPAERRRALHEQIAAVMAEAVLASQLSASPSTSSGRTVRRPGSRFETAAGLASRAGQVGRRRPSTWARSSSPAGTGH